MIACHRHQYPPVLSHQPDNYPTFKRVQTHPFTTTRGISDSDDGESNKLLPIAATGAKHPPHLSALIRSAPFGSGGAFLVFFFSRWCCRWRWIGRC